MVANKRAPNPLAKTKTIVKYRIIKGFGNLVGFIFNLDNAKDTESNVIKKIDTFRPCPKKTTGLKPPYLTCWAQL